MIFTSFSQISLVFDAAEEDLGEIVEREREELKQRELLIEQF